MTIKYYPDGLPFGLIQRFGLPFHGIVKDGALTLPDASTMVYPQPEGTDMTYVKHPLGAAPERTPEEIAWDAARNYQWLDHAYLSGYYRSIGGVDFSRATSNPTTDYWLYCSATKTWLIRATRQTLTGKVRITLAARRFGEFGIPQNPDLQNDDVFADIGSHEFIVKDYDDNNVTNEGSTYYLGTTHKRDGSVSVLNFQYSPNFTDYFSVSFDFCGAIKLTLTGDEADELAVSGVDLCIGSQIATQTESDIDAVPHVVLQRGLVYSDGYIELQIPNDSERGVVQVVTEHWTTLVDNVRTEYGAGTYQQTDGGYPTTSHTESTSAAEVNFYYFVTPIGEISNFSTEYAIGQTTDYSVTFDGGQITGWGQCYCGFWSAIGGCADGYYEHTNNGTQNLAMGSVYTYQEGIIFTVSLGATDYDATHTFTVSATVDGAQVIQWFGCDGIGNVDSVATDSTHTEIYEENINGQTTIISEVGGLTGDLAPALSVYNNNIIDVRRNENGTMVYAFSLTILGEKFNRESKQAVMDPRTGTVHLSASAGEPISII